jgi:hypothetical protein
MNRYANLLISGAGAALLLVYAAAIALGLFAPVAGMKEQSFPIPAATPAPAVQ